MKYYLAIDKGKAYANNRYLNLDLRSISPKLEENNNLRYLIRFTTGFDDCAQLKEYLMRLRVLKESLKYFDLAIVYYRKYKGKYYAKSLPVMYSSIEELLDFDTLVKVCYYLLNDINTYNLLLAGFIRIDPRLYDACYYLRLNILNNVHQDIIARELRNILHHICYLKQGNDFKINYSKLLRVVALVSRFDINRKVVNTSKSRGISSFKEEELFHLEELLDRSHKTEECKKKILQGYSEEYQLKRILEM